MNDEMIIDEEAREKLLAAVGAAMGHEPTRVFVRWIIDQTGVFDQAFTGDSATFFNEGKRDVGLSIIEVLQQVDPYEFVRLMKDAADDVVRLRTEAKARSQNNV